MLQKFIFWASTIAMFFIIIFPVIYNYSAGEMAPWSLTIAVAIGLGIIGGLVRCVLATKGSY